MPGQLPFPGGVGNTQQDAARFTSLIDDVEARLFGTLPDSTWVYPGHGGDTTLGAERPHLAEWRDRGCSRPRWRTPAAQQHGDAAVTSG